MAQKDREADPLVELMVGYQNGSMEAFEDLFTALSTHLRNYLTSLTRDLDRAQDLVQETFLQMHRSRQTYRPERPVKPWAFGIARNVYLMDRRARWRRGRHEQQTVHEVPELAVPALAQHFPDRDGVDRALARLAPDRREALLLHHVWGFSFKEIGGFLGISQRAAKLRSFRGMRALRQMLMGEGAKA